MKWMEGCLAPLFPSVSCFSPTVTEKNIMIMSRCHERPKENEGVAYLHEEVGATFSGSPQFVLICNMFGDLLIPSVQISLKRFVF